MLKLLTSLVSLELNWRDPKGKNTSVTVRELVTCITYTTFSSRGTVKLSKLPINPHTDAISTTKQTMPYQSTRAKLSYSSHPGSIQAEPGAKNSAERQLIKQSLGRHD